MSKNVVPVPFKNTSDAARFFGQKPRLLHAYETLPPSIRTVVEKLLVMLSDGFGELRPANQAQFRLLAAKTYCEVHLQRDFIKASINVDDDENWVPKCSLKPLGPPRPHGHAVERFVDYRVSSLEELPDLLALIAAAYKHWSSLASNKANALFINGVYDRVLREILAAQDGEWVIESYLQPHSGQVIRMLRDFDPSIASPVRLYASTTDNLNHICYTGQIVRWDDKRDLSKARFNQVLRHLKKYQTGEEALLIGDQQAGENSVNLLTVRNLQVLHTMHSTALLRKVSDGLPLQKRTRAGGWSEVFDLGEVCSLPSKSQEQYDTELIEAVIDSESLSDAALKKRLSAAPRIPTRVQVLSIGFQRNSDVIVAVLRRAKGTCERCGKNAPFLRRRDNSPYLEVHHLVQLCDGGEDTTENAAALCPNCHRDLHYGVVSGSMA